MDEGESKQSKEAIKLTLKLRKLSIILVLVMILTVYTLTFMGVLSWLAVLVGMIILCVPIIIVGAKIDRMLGIPEFKRIHGIPKIEGIKMLLLDFVNLIIFIMAYTINIAVYGLILAIAGALMLFGLTIPQGNRMAHMNREITIKNLPPEKRKAAEEAFDILMKNGKEKESDNESCILLNLLHTSQTRSTYKALGCAVDPKKGMPAHSGIFS